MIKLNLGCGDYPLEGFVNVDTLERFGDEHWDILNPPYNNNSVDEIYAGHVIEHIFPDTVPRALHDWRLVLKPGGILTVVIPDFDKAFRLYQEGKIDLETLNGIIYGYNDSPDYSEWHKHLVSEQIAKKWLIDVFGNAKTLPDSPYAPANPEWQTTIKAVK